MLWYKVWRESRVRFLISGVALACFCVLMVVIQKQIRGAGGVPLGMRGQSYSEHIYNFIYGTGKGMLLIFVLPFLGLGGLKRESVRGTASFTSALPISRNRVIGAQIGIGLIETAVLSLLPALIVPAISPLVSESYPFSQSIHFSVLWFVCGMFVFAIAFVYSVLLSGEYSAPMACVITVVAQNLILASKPLASYRMHVAWIAGEFGTMHWDAQRNLLLSGPLPWMALAVFMIISLALFALSAFIVNRQDF